jgi:hypothetical protein
MPRDSPRRIRPGPGFFPRAVALCLPDAPSRPSATSAARGAILAGLPENRARTNRHRLVLELRRGVPGVDEIDLQPLARRSRPGEPSYGTFRRRCPEPSAPRAARQSFLDGNVRNRRPAPAPEPRPSSYANLHAIAGARVHANRLDVQVGVPARETAEVASGTHATERIRTNPRAPQWTRPAIPAAFRPTTTRRAASAAPRAARGARSGPRVPPDPGERRRDRGVGVGGPAGRQGPLPARRGIMRGSKRV